jgi:hypothetical protein
MTASIYIQNKSTQGEVLELLALDGIHIMATLTPGQYVEVKAKDGTAITPFITRQQVKK